MDTFHLLRPWWLLALVPWLWLSWRLWRRDSARDTWRTVCDEALLPFILEGAPAGRNNTGVLCLALAGTLGIAALAGPTWRELPQPVYRQQEALVVVLDLSRSMDAADVTPDRITRARLKVRDLIAQRRDGQTALVVFAGDAFIVTPLTDDVNTIDALVPSLTTDLMPVPGTRTDRALDTARALLERAGARGGRVILITDSAGSTPVHAAVARLADAGHRLAVIGVGTPDGAPIPIGDGDVVKDSAGRTVIARLAEADLKAVARAGNGGYARLSVDDRDLTRVLSASATGWSWVSTVTGLTSDRWREEGPWLLLVLLPVASLAFRRGLLVLVMAVLLPLPEPAAALDWATPWHNDDQRGAQAFQAEDYETAITQFKDPEWKAAALYRAGRFAEAAAMLESLPQADALYNRGNALARLGQLDEAMGLYEQVLRAEPGHADARHNLELLRRLRSAAPPPGGARGQNRSTEPPPRARRGAASGSRGPTDASPPQSAGDSAPDTGSTQPASEPPPSDPAGGQAAVEERSAAPQVQTDSRAAALGDDLSPPADQSRRAMEQWLRQIRDDPGGLLRRKFRYQYSRRPPGEAATTEPW